MDFPSTSSWDYSLIGTDTLISSGILSEAVNVLNNSTELEPCLPEKQVLNLDRQDTVSTLLKAWGLSELEEHFCSKLMEKSY